MAEIGVSFRVVLREEDLEKLCILECEGLQLLQSYRNHCKLSCTCFVTIHVIKKYH